MHGGQKLFRKSEQAPRTRSRDARGPDRLEYPGRDQEGRPNPRLGAKAMVARHLGFITQSRLRAGQIGPARIVAKEKRSSKLKPHPGFRLPFFQQKITKLRPPRTT